MKTEGVTLKAVRKCLIIAFKDWVGSNEVEEPRAWYTEWSKSEREKQWLYTNAYIWNLEIWNWWNYVQRSNGDADIENRLMDMGGGQEGEGGMCGESNMETYRTISKIGSQWESALWLRELKPGLCNKPRGVGMGREIQQGGDISTPMTDSCWGLAETNKFMYSNYPSIKQLI